MFDDLGDAIADVARSGARAALLDAAGPDFCFGGDIVPWPEMTARGLRTAAGNGQRLGAIADPDRGRNPGSILRRRFELDAFMQGAGFTARLTSAIDYEMWEKWVLLATVGGITCLMRGNLGEVVAAPGGPSFILSLFEEVVSVVKAVGQAPQAAFVENTRRMLTTPGSPQTPSMFRDLQQGSPIEGDQIVGDLIARGEKAGVAAPLLSAAYAHLSVYQHRLAT